MKYLNLVIRTIETLEEKQFNGTITMTEETQLNTMIRMAEKLIN